jgi:hypothetical protein
MTTSFIFLQSIVNYRVPIDEDGKLGTPEIISKFTKETYAPKKKEVKPDKQQKVDVSIKTEDITYEDF